MGPNSVQTKTRNENNQNLADTRWNVNRDMNGLRGFVKSELAWGNRTDLRALAIASEPGSERAIHTTRDCIRGQGCAAAARMTVRRLILAVAAVAKYVGEATIARILANAATSSRQDFWAHPKMRCAHKSRLFPAFA
jgi:hypothetical protein